MIFNEKKSSMHFTENKKFKQGTFRQQRLVFDKAPERPNGEAEKAEEKVEKQNPRALLAELNAEIGVEKPLKEMIALERTLTAEGQTAEYKFQNEKLTATKEKNGVVWRNEKGEVINKAEWLKEKTDAATSEEEKDLGTYWTDLSKKYDQDESVRKTAEKEAETDLKKAEADDIYHLQGGWDKLKMSRMFLGDKLGEGLTFKVDLKGNDKFENYVGAADILPETVSKILVIDKNGGQRSGERKIVSGRAGYYDAQGYIPVFSGYTIRIEETIVQESNEALETQKKEQENHEGMHGTIWHKNDSAPTELTPNINAKTGYRYEQIDGKRVEVKPPKPEEKHYEAPEPVAVQKIENPQSNEEYFQFGKERAYINYPKDLKKYNKPPRVVAYFHGNNGNIDENLDFLTASVNHMRENGDPVILVVPENRMGGWQDFQRAGQFSRLMALVNQESGAEVDDITLSSHSGGYQAVENILKFGDENSHIKTLALLDSAYGASNQQFIKFMNDPDHPERKLRSTFTAHLAGKNQEMIAGLLPGVQADQDGPDKVWHDETGRIDIRTSRTSHGNTKRVYFESFVS